MRTSKRKIFAGLVVTGLVCAFIWVSWQIVHPPRPLFANAMEIDPETGRAGWHVDHINCVSGDEIEYEESLNLLVVGRRSSNSELLLMPGRAGDELRAASASTSIRLPLWKNSVIVFDKTGVQKIIYLKNRRAKELYRSIQANNDYLKTVLEAGPEL